MGDSERGRVARFRPSQAGKTGPAPAPTFTVPDFTFIMSRFFRQAGDSDSDTDTESSEEELMSSGDEAPSKPSAASSKPTGMARFLRTADDSDSSDSDSDDDDDSDGSDEEEKATKKKSRYLVGGDDDDDSDEDVKRVVKSAKDKRLEEMEATGKIMENALKINDWVAISNGTLFDFCAVDWADDRYNRIR